MDFAFKLFTLYFYWKVSYYRFSIATIDTYDIVDKSLFCVNYYNGKLTIELFYKTIYGDIND